MKTINLKIFSQATLSRSSKSKQHSHVSCLSQFYQEIQPTSRKSSDRKLKSWSGARDAVAPKAPECRVRSHMHPSSAPGMEGHSSPGITPLVVACLGSVFLCFYVSWLWGCGRLRERERERAGITISFSPSSSKTPNLISYTNPWGHSHLSSLRVGFSFWFFLSVHPWREAQLSSSARELHHVYKYCMFVRK